MSPRVKRLPRLWCAMQGLLPREACLAAQRGELACPPGEADSAVLPGERAAGFDHPPTKAVPRRATARGPGR